MIALIDCNNFYCACETVFQPGLLGRALVVLSNNDGCAIARNEEAKALGINMAQPAFLAGDLIRRHGVAVHSSNYALYGNMSERVMEVIRDFVPRTEVYSIDEIFADLSGMRYANLYELASALREAVSKSTGIPVSIGIASTKTLAKMANRYAKRSRSGDGVFVADNPERVEAMLEATRIDEIWGIGKEHASLLRSNGFDTASAFVARAPEKWVQKQMSVVGQRLWNELRGISCIPWEEAAGPRKNICTSRSFGQLITSKKEIRQAIAKFTSSCAEKLRREKTCARKLQVFIQTNPHRPEDDQYFQAITLTLPVASSLSTELMKFAMRGLDLIFQPGYRYQKAGVRVLHLVPAAEVQLALFDGQARDRDKKIMDAVDGVNSSFGRDRVRFGVQGYEQRWKLKQNNLSPAYTTRLDHIPKAG